MKIELLDYLEALDGAGPKLRELVLDRAAHDPAIDLNDLVTLAKAADPDHC